MLNFPHLYVAQASSQAEGDVTLDSDRLPTLHSAPPAEFGGPGDRWSPETLLVAAIADCFVLTFRAVARASKVPWTALRCDVDGTLDRVDRKAQFTHFVVRAHLQIPTGGEAGPARRALEQAERQCLISNSLKATIQMEAFVDGVEEPACAVTDH